LKSEKGPFAEGPTMSRGQEGRPTKTEGNAIEKREKKWERGQSITQVSSLEGVIAGKGEDQGEETGGRSRTSRRLYPRRFSGGFLKNQKKRRRKWAY